LKNIIFSLAEAMFIPCDNDGLWTSMYLASQIFRYAVTQDSEVKAQAWRHFEATELLNLVTGSDNLDYFMLHSYFWQVFLAILRVHSQSVVTLFLTLRGILLPFIQLFSLKVIFHLMKSVVMSSYILSCMIYWQGATKSLHTHFQHHKSYSDS
jgi:hypothetical protein